jgi:hypothetical protein
LSAARAAGASVQAQGRLANPSPRVYRAIDREQSQVEFATPEDYLNPIRWSSVAARQTRGARSAVILRQRPAILPERIALAPALDTLPFCHVVAYNIVMIPIDYLCNK